MLQLAEIFKGLTLKEVLDLEKNDLQYKSLEKLYFNIENKVFYLYLILANSIICYQLSSTGEEYWEEFHQYFSGKKGLKKENIINELSKFIKQSKGNRRLLNIKLKRLEKIKFFLNEFIKKEDFYYENMEKLLYDLSKIINQKQNAKTMVFAIKMFSYGARIKYNRIIIIPKSIPMPIDSRLEKIYKKYYTGNKNIDKFYFDLCKKLNIPPLHFDGVLWGKYKDLIEKY